MTLKNISWTFLAPLFSLSFALGQEKIAHVEFTPVPAYPASGQIPDELKDRFVFIDFAAGDIVVSYPDQNASGGRKTLRFGRRNQVDPSIKATVAKGSDKEYVYRYVLTNGEGAKRALESFAISVGGSAGEVKAAHPAWSRSERPSEVTRPGSIRSETLQVWKATTPTAALARAGTSSGFELRSELKPGLTIGFAEGTVDSVYTEAVAQTLPAAVKEQMALVSNPHWDSAQVMTIAPKFKNEDPKELIAMDFHRGLNQLAIQGPLKPKSPFVTSAISSLALYMSTPGAASLDLTFLDKASEPLELEIAQAMRMSLQQ